MVRRKHASQILRGFGLLLAVLMVASGAVADIFVAAPFGWVQPVLIVLGLAWAAAVFRISPRLQLRIYICGGTFVGTVLLAELTFRLAGYDFDKKKTRYEALAIFFRQPHVPLDPVYFRRPGPDEWRGKPMTEMVMEHYRVRPEAYADEQAVHIRYDDEGFRNNDDLEDWQIAVAGDSFTELGFLGHEALFTTILSQRLNVKVKNLGVSYTATFTHLAYLKAMGGSPSTKHWVIVFYEGNDLGGLRSERSALEHFAATGERPYREVRKAIREPQTSLLTATSDWLRGAFARKRTPYGNAFFLQDESKILVSLKYTPSNEAELPISQTTALKQVLSEFAEAAGQRQIKPWLVYMPCKYRVCYSRLKITPQADTRIQNWSPSDLPLYVARLCRERGITPIDTTQALIQSPILAYNSIYDDHLNRQGSKVVADVMLSAMREAVAATVSRE